MTPRGGDRLPPEPPQVGDHERAAALIDEFLLPGSDRFTLEEAAALAGVDAEVATRLWRAMGFPDPPADHRIAGAMDVTALRYVTERIDSPETLDNSIRQTRIHAAAIARIAELWVDELRHALDEGVSVDQALESELPALDPERATWLLGYAHRRLLAAGLRRELASRSVGATSERGVAFADLVGFTTLTERIGPRELARLIECFEGLAYDTVAVHGGRVVKTIGDEVLYTAEDPEVVVTISETMIHAAPRLALPPLRIGAEYGVAVWHEGDLYGPAVNRAARIVAEASPGRFLASAEFAGRVETRRWEPSGRYDLKGIGEVDLLTTA